MSRKSPRAGFSLLESLVAVAILGLALPLLFETVQSAIARMSTAERQDAAWRVANDVMTETVETLHGATGTREGRQGDLAWRVETALADDDANGGPGEGAGNRLFRVRVTVRFIAGARSEEPITLDTLKLDTTSR